MLTSTPASYAEGPVPSTLLTTEGALFSHVLPPDLTFVFVFFVM